MKKEECYELGHIIKAKGLKGELVLYLDVDDPEEYEDMESVFVEINDTMVPYFINQIRLEGKRATVQFDEVTDVETAKLLIGAKLFLSLDNLPPLGQNQFYYHEVVGYHIVDQQLGLLGKITGIYDSGTQDLIAMDYEGKEVLIPLVDDFIRGVDHERRELTVNLPDGLLDIYLAE
ncbi:MAG: 16S rRNA processing protein RimM [Bacteroidia bacterium]|nr:16S rRNA processing protein RimM [Bacteroidia bacterium]